MYDTYQIYVMQLCLNGAPNNVNKFSGMYAEKNINL